MSNAFPAVLYTAAGLIAGVGVVSMGKSRFKQWHREKRWVQHVAVVLEYLPPTILAIVASVFELWKRTTWATADNATYAAYGLAGACISFAGAFKWLLSVAKGLEKEQIEQLEAEKKALATERDRHQQQRDFLLRVQAETAVIIKAKLARIAAARDEIAASGDLHRLAKALAPRDQLNLLMRALYQHFQKSVLSPSVLRVGMYARSDEDPQVLIAVAAWDGEHNDCFSNRHQKYMRLDNPGGAQSLVVECYRSPKALLRIEDCIAASVENPPRFTFFSPEQREKIKSMVAYRYNLEHTKLPSAIVLTLDTSQPKFFSDALEFECEILLKEIGQRIELELTSLEVLKHTQKQEPKP